VLKLKFIEAAVENRELFTSGKTLEIKDHGHTLSFETREMHILFWYESLEEVTLKTQPTWKHIIKVHT
jgi:hypothetical protein